MTVPLDLPPAQNRAQRRARARLRTPHWDLLAQMRQAYAQGSDEVIDADPQLLARLEEAGLVQPHPFLDVYVPV